jgi:hypothetical protein
MKVISLWKDDDSHRATTLNMTLKFVSQPQGLGHGTNVMRTACVYIDWGGMKMKILVEVSGAEVKGDLSTTLNDYY